VHNFQNYQTMEGLTFKAENNISKLLGEGEHATEIIGVALTQSTQNPDYADRTPQVEVTFGDEKGRSIKSWLNLKGFKTFSRNSDKDVEGKDFLSEKEQESGKFEARGPFGYAVNKKSGIRIESTSKTASARSIIGKLGVDCGIPEGNDFSMEDLQGKSVGIKVIRNNNGQLRVHYSMPAAEVSTPEFAK